MPSTPPIVGALNGKKKRMVTEVDLGTRWDVTKLAICRAEKTVCRAEKTVCRAEGRQAHLGQGGISQDLQVVGQSKADIELTNAI